MSLSITLLNGLRPTLLADMTYLTKSNTHVSFFFSKTRSIPGDVLTPYQQGFHGSPHSHRHTRECQPTKYGNSTFQSSYNQNTTQQQTKVNLPIVTVKRFYDDFAYGRMAAGHIAYIDNPLRTLSVLEPEEVGGCESKRRVAVAKTSEQRKCFVATNAGYFNTHTGECYGNIVSDERLVQNSHGVQNAHFGIRQDGELVFG